ncbi:alpha-tocopherol transfer protein-like [Lycorma delicatula]|uniref:alpha-tocopherol transfer protein-like n=1 Tax=Lycorma delicatula TaxID=130591 RepID=UPI003F515C9A
MTVAGLGTVSEAKPRLYKEYNMTPEGIKNDIQSIKEWVVKQPHLPNFDKEINVDTWMENILLMVKNSVTKAKSVIDLYFSSRTIFPSLFSGRDPTEPAMKQSFENLYIAILPGLTPDCHRAIFMKIISPEPDDYNLEAQMKRCLMMMETYLREGVDFTGIIVVHDFKYLKLGHLTQFNIQLLKMMSAGMKAYPFRIPKTIIMNAPAHFDALMTVTKPFINAKVMARVKLLKDTEKLSDELPKEMVPLDYGGVAPSLEELNNHWKDILMKQRPYYAAVDGLKTNESLRLEKKYTQTEFGESGSFRKLAVD